MEMCSPGPCPVGHLGLKSQLIWHQVPPRVGVSCQKDPEIMRCDLST